VCALAALGGDVLVSGDVGGGLRLWDAASGVCLHAEKAGWVVCAVAAVGCGRFVASVGGALVFYEHSRGRRIARVGDVTAAHADWVRGLAVWGARVASASDDGTAAVWCAESLERRAVLKGHTDWVDCVAMDARHVVTGSVDASMRVYDAESFGCVRVLSGLHTDVVYSVALVGNGRVLSASIDMSVLLVDVHSGACEERVELPFQVLAAITTRDGSIAAVGSDGGCMILPAPAEAARGIAEKETADSGRRRAWPPPPPLPGSDEEYTIFPAPAEAPKAIAKREASACRKRRAWPAPPPLPDLIELL
jgi:WD40 repeat protein